MWARPQPAVAAEVGAGLQGRQGVHGQMQAVLSAAQTSTHRVLKASAALPLYLRQEKTEEQIAPSPAWPSTSTSTLTRMRSPLQWDLTLHWDPSNTQPDLQVWGGGQPQRGSAFDKSRKGVWIWWPWGGQEKQDAHPYV